MYYSDEYITDIFRAGTGEYNVFNNYGRVRNHPNVKCLHLPHLAEFVREAAKSDKQWVIITDGFCDHTVWSDGVISHRVTATVLPQVPLPLPPQIRYWYGQNLNINIPGITYPQFIGILNLDQYFQFVVRNPNFVVKRGLCYMNFGFTSPDRQKMYTDLRSKGFVTDGVVGVLHGDGDYFHDKTRLFYKDTAEHKYAIVPPGHGIDTFRLYETLCVRTIPIVLNTPFYRHFENWPVLIVPDFSVITEEMLNARYEELNARFDSYYGRLRRSSMAAEIEQAAEECHGSRPSDS